MPSSVSVLFYSLLNLWRVQVREVKSPYGDIIRAVLELVGTSDYSVVAARILVELNAPVVFRSEIL